MDTPSSVFSGGWIESSGAREPSGRATGMNGGHPREIRGRNPLGSSTAGANHSTALGETLTDIPVRRRPSPRAAPAAGLRL